MHAAKPGIFICLDVISIFVAVWFTPSVFTLQNKTTTQEEIAACSRSGTMGALTALIVAALLLCSGVVQAAYYFENCSESGVHFLYEKENNIIFENGSYYYSAAVYMCHNGTYIPVCSNAIRSSEAELLCSNKQAIYGMLKCK